MLEKTTRRERVKIDWPEAEFSAEEVYQSFKHKISRVSIHSKINKAVSEGGLSIVGKSQSQTGRPRTLYLKNGE